MLRPPPLRTDGSNPFARYSMQERVPRIARDVLERNRDYARSIVSAVDRLAAEIERDGPVPAPKFPGPDLAAWADAAADHAGETWLDAAWFFAELAFYREMTHACRFWETGRDPFAPVKEEELSGDRPWSRLEAALEAPGRPRDERIASLLEASLWGNRVDLSYTVAAERAHTLADDLLVDERARALPDLTSPGAHVHLVADNTGTELALDLALLAAVLEDPAAHVTMHLKIQPMFVSDALPRDVWRLVERMRDRGGVLHSLATKLDAGFAAGRLVLAPDAFWNGPRFLWDVDGHLRAALGEATAVVLKGDANYRRLVGDAMWAPSAPFATAAGAFPTTLVALRTMKSDPVLGLPPGVAEKLDATEPRWRIDGQRGVLQVHTPSG
ncbi:MAG TPA: ARMT1-like domain-containing protein [Polyangiaceae bacterium]